MTIAMDVGFFKAYRLASQDIGEVFLVFFTILRCSELQPAFLQQFFTAVAHKPGIVGIVKIVKTTIDIEDTQTFALGIEYVLPVGSLFFGFIFTQRRKILFLPFHHG